MNNQIDINNLNKVIELNEKNKNLFIYLYNLIQENINDFKSKNTNDKSININYKTFFNENLIFLISDILTIFNKVKDFSNLTIEDKINIVLVAIIYIICFELKLDENITQKLIQLSKNIIPLIIEDISNYNYSLLTKEIRKINFKKIFCCCKK